MISRHGAPLKGVMDTITRKGLRKNQFDGHRHAAVSNLQMAAYDIEES